MAGDAIYLMRTVAASRHRICRLAVAIALPLAIAASPAPLTPDQLAHDIARFDSFGIKQTGSRGNLATLAWIDQRLRGLGYMVETQAFAQPTWRMAAASVDVGSRRVEAFPLSPPRFTPPSGVTGPLRNWDGQTPPHDSAGAVLLLLLKDQRHSSARLSLKGVALDAAQRAGAAAIVIATRGPTGDLIALNADADQPLPPLPIVLVAGREAAHLQAQAAAATPVRLRIAGAALPPGQARNVIARRVRGANWIVISTPVSGWFHATAERGPGVAIFLALAARLAAAAPCDSIALIATSGHETGYGGMAAALDAGLLPPPATTRAWIHLGAGLAAYDQERRGPEPTRYLLATPPLANVSRRAFAGVAGYEAPYPLDRQTALGETEVVVARGYPNVVGAVSAHAFHHSRNDRRDRTSGALLVPVAAGFDRLLQAELAPGTCR
jgi:hypothetical protein